MRSLRALPALLILAAAPLPAPAQESLLSNGSNGAVEIEAEDGIEWLRNLRQYRAHGNATARRGGVTVVADTLTAYYREKGGHKKIFRLDADGHVLITSNDSQASGDKAVYYVDKQVAVLVGEALQMVTGQETITAEESLEYWDGRRIAVARGDALVIENDRRLKAGVLTAFIGRTAEGRSRFTRIDATGGVHISTPTDIVTGKEGVYIVAEEKATLCGGVKITQGQNQLNGECAVVNIKTGRSKLQGSGSGDKVKGLILRTE